MSNWVVRVWVRLVSRERSSGGMTLGDGVVSRGAPETADGEAKGGIAEGGGMGLGEGMASPSWECAIGEDSRKVSAGSGEEMRVGSAEREGGNWTGCEGDAEGMSVSVSISMSVSGGNELRAIWSKLR